jgi:cobalt/nickel transport system permease protein
MLFSVNQMHIPDGFLSIFVAIFFWFVSGIGLAVALKKVNKVLNERDLPLMGILGAAIFAGQMINFSVTGGTSGHLMGAALATILLGPWQAIIVMTSVVTVQAVIFQDGGVLVLGANIFNMAIIAVTVTYFIKRAIEKLIKDPRRELFFSSFLAAWFSVFISSLSAALMLSISGTSPANLAVPAMAGIHALIGIGEGLITIGAVTFIYSNRRELLSKKSEKQAGNQSIIVSGVFITLVLVALAPLASSQPDGLEWVASKMGFINIAKDPFYRLIPDYLIPGLQNELVATILAGIIGAVVVFSIIYGITYNRQKPASKEAVSIEQYK